MPTRGYGNWLKPNPRMGGPLLLVLPEALFGLPRLETVVVKPNHAQVIRADKAHALVDPYRLAAGADLLRSDAG